MEGRALGVGRAVDGDTFEGLMSQFERCELLSRAVRESLYAMMSVVVQHTADVEMEARAVEQLVHFEESCSDDLEPSSSVYTHSLVILGEVLARAHLVNGEHGESAMALYEMVQSLLETRARNTRACEEIESFCSDTVSLAMKKGAWAALPAEVVRWESGRRSRCEGRLIALCRRYSQGITDVGEEVEGTISACGEDAAHVPIEVINLVQDPSGCAALQLLTVRFDPHLSRRTYV